MAGLVVDGVHAGARSAAVISSALILPLGLDVGALSDRFAG